MSSVCELCTQSHPREIWRNRNFYVIDASDKDLAGFVRVIATQHIKEMSELDENVRKELFEILTLIERVMIEVMSPDKVNWASLGNMVPHVHWHIIARYQDDAFFPGSVWSAKLRETDPKTLSVRRQQAQVMLDKIAQALKLRFA